MGLEEEIAELRAAGDARGAATRAIRGYGPEVLGFLLSYTGNDDDADDVFAQASVDLWESMPRFEARCSARVWFYTLARHAAARMWRSPMRRRAVRLDDVGELVARVKTETPAYLKSEVKDAFASIRMALDADDRMLLVLRVDRQMSWNDIARVFVEEEASDDSEASLARVAARLRKRFQTVKEEIRERARASGIGRAR